MQKTGKFDGVIDILLWIVIMGGHYKFKKKASKCSLSKFYGSLLTQNPRSKMALKWCVENGILTKNSHEKAQRALITLDLETIKLSSESQ